MAPVPAGRQADMQDVAELNAPYRHFWEHRFERLKDYLNELQRKEQP